MAWCGSEVFVWYDFGTGWYGIVWFGMVWVDMGRPDMVWYVLV